METVIGVASNLTQYSHSKIVGNDDSVFVQNFQFNLTVFLTTILVTLISAPFITIVIGVVMFTANKNDEGSEAEKSEVETSTLKNVPFTSFLWIFIQKRTDILKNLEEFVKRFGPAFKLNILGLIRIICINDPVMLKKLDIFMEPVHLHKPSWYHKIMPRLSKNDSTTSAQREALVQAFNKKNLQNHFAIFKEHSEKLTLTLQENMKYETKQRNMALDAAVSKCTFDILMDISFGKEVDIKCEDKIQLLKYFERVRHLAAFCFNHHFMLPTFLWALHPVKWYMDRTIRQIYKIFNKIVENTYKQEKTEAQRAIIADMSGKSLIDVMSAAGLSMEEITAEITAFIAWGHGTVSTSLEKLIFYLANRKDYQAKCRQEVNVIFENAENNSSNKYVITNEALNKLEFLDRCIQECLRLYPTFPLISRNVNTTVQLDKNITIPAGTNVLTSHWLLHQNPYTFLNPERFNPDRFLSDKLQNREVYEYMSCSLGLQNCTWYQLISQQLKVFTSLVLRDFELCMETQTENMQKLSPFVTSAPKTLIKLRRRQLN